MWTTNVLLVSVPGPHEIALRRIAPTCHCLHSGLNATPSASQPFVPGGASES